MFSGSFRVGRKSCRSSISQLVAENCARADRCDVDPRKDQTDVAGQVESVARLIVSSSSLTRRRRRLKELHEARDVGPHGFSAESAQRRPVAANEAA